MTLRPEFELLDYKCTKLRLGQDLSQDLLKEIRTHIELCEHIAQTDEERSVVGRTIFWWKKRSTNFGLSMPIENFVPTEGGGRKLLPAPPKKYELSANDRRFLRSLCITADEPSKGGNNGV